MDEERQSVDEVRRSGEEEPIQKEWLSYPEAQVYVGLGKTKLWEMIRAGELKAARVGRAVRISRQDLDDFMRRLTEE